MNSYKYECISKTIYVYHMSNNVAFNIMNIKTKNMLIINNKKQVNKMGVRDSYQII